VLKTLQEWLQEGEQLYDVAVNDYRNLESQLDDLEQRLAAKLHEVNQIAQMMGKPPMEPAKRFSAQIIEAPGRNGAGVAANPGNLPAAVGTHGSHDDRNHAPSSPSFIARALTGRNLNR
jgi:hypothetical protein